MALSSQQVFAAMLVDGLDPRGFGKPLAYISHFKNQIESENGGIAPFMA
jgi:hypothetical protein